VVTLGVRGYLREDEFYYHRTTYLADGGWYSDTLGMTSSRGRLLLEVSRERVDGDGDGLHHDGHQPEDLTVGDNNRLGQAAGRFGFGLGAYTWSDILNFGPFYHISGIDILLPSWFLALLFSLLPALRLRRYLLDRQRNRPGFCRQCGYDLRATPLRCPECGTVASPLSVVRSQ